jgi:hypothetical protein
LNGYQRVKWLIKSVLLGGPDQVPRTSEEGKTGIEEEKIMDATSRKYASLQHPCGEAVLADKSIAILEQHPYSPDSAPCDYCLFPKQKYALKRTHFQSAEEVK